MARVLHPTRSVISCLSSPCLVGRSRACQLRDASPEASAEHALFRWYGGRWTLQDLHSRNGTFVEGRQLVPGQPIPLARGSRLGFGHPEGYVLIDDGPPEPFATRASPEGEPEEQPDGPPSTVESRHGRLSLPVAAGPAPLVVQRDGRWWLERDGRATPVEDGDEVTVGGVAWVLRLPELLSSTLDAPEALAAPPTLASIHLELAVAEPPEEVVELVVRVGSRATRLEPRAHHRPMLLLARARSGDRTPREEERGWVEQDWLVAQLGYSTSRLHVEIHRIRREFAAIGIVDAHMVVERRPQARNLRFGIDQVQIVMVERRATPS